MFNFSPSQGGAHGDQKQHKIFTALGSRSLKPTGTMDCDKLTGSDCEHLLLSHGVLSGKKTGTPGCDSSGIFWTPNSWHSLDLHGLQKEIPQ